MKYGRQAFTIVELCVVIAVISILALVSIYAYTASQKQGRDADRNSDITLAKNELEKFYDKNGVYPPGCPLASCTNTLLTDNTISAIITPATTIANLQAILPNLASTFGDPRVPTAGTPFMDISGTNKEYFYFGGTVNYRASASSASYGNTTIFPCTIQSSLNPGDVGGYIIGYFSEATNQWVLSASKRGVVSTVTAGLASDGCVINT
jgi:prepilin-type N-terminal cleavage/methylation domain-containing protein